MSTLVQTLCSGDHRVEVSLRPDRSVQAFKDAIDRGYVLILFPHTKGGTELGFSIDQERSLLSQADWEGQTGSVCVVGSLVLDYVRVRCIATIELPALHGTGRLEKVGAK